MSGAILAVASGVGSILVTRTYNSGTAATETVPSGASRVVIEVWGGGGGGGTGDSVAPNYGGGGGSGGYVRRTVSLTSSNWGQTFTYTVGAGGASDAIGGDSTVASGTFSGSVSLSAIGGNAGENGTTGRQGSGGLASGGDVNTAGNGDGGVTRTGAGAPNGGGNVAAGTGSTPGGGGGGGSLSGGAGGKGGAGRIIFAYT